MSISSWSLKAFESKLKAGVAAVESAVRIKTPQEIKDKVDFEWMMRKLDMQRALMTGPRATPPKLSTILRRLRDQVIPRRNPLNGYCWGPLEKIKRVRVI